MIDLNLLESIKSIFVNTKNESTVSFFINNKEVISRSYGDLYDQLFFLLSHSKLDHKIIKSFINITPLNIEVYLEKLSNSLSYNENDRIYSILFYALAYKIYTSMNLTESITENYKDFKMYQGINEDITNHWYRGQVNINWKLLPSFYRTKTNVRKIEEINHSYLFEDYKKNGVIYRLKKIMENEIKKESDLKYEQFAYVQHSIAYTHLLDFTSDIKVAESFALGNSNSIHDFNNIDSMIYELIILSDNTNQLSNKEEIDYFLQNEYKLYIVNKYVLGSDVGTNKIKTVRDLIQILTPKYKLINVQTNDRMRYQKGKFLVFYDCLVVGGEIFFNLNTNLKFKKYVLKAIDKQRVNNLGNHKWNYLDELSNNFPEYKIDNLLNPYKYMGE